jgi:IS5 family transposase
MPPKQPQPNTFELFQSRLDNMLDPDHPLVKLAGLIDWSRFDVAFGRFYTPLKGRPSLPTRLMAGLHLIKHMEGLSDEIVCARWIENPYWQQFCGEQYFRRKLPFDRSSMSLWRERIGPDKLELLLAETIAVATRTEAVTPSACARVTIDTTVQTKAVAYPTDSHLLLRGIEWLNRLAKRHGIKLRQSFLRIARRARGDVARLLHAGRHAQAMRRVRKMRTWLGRLDRDIGRKIAGDATLEDAFTVARNRVGRLLAQKRDDKNKLYALHAPEVECSGKGKARTRYEFGVKTSIAVTNARTSGSQLIISPASPSNAPMSIAVIRATATRAKPASSSRECAASPHAPSAASSKGEAPSNPSSVTPNPMACSNETISPVPMAMPTTPSSSPPDTICGCSSPFGVSGSHGSPSRPSPSTLPPNHRPHLTPRSTDPRWSAHRLQPKSLCSRTISPEISRK